MEQRYLCKKCGLEFLESEFSAITEDEKDICPACGKVDCFEELEADNDD